MKEFKSCQVCPLNKVKSETKTFWETDKKVEVKQHTPTQTKGQKKNHKRKQKIVDTWKVNKLTQLVTFITGGKRLKSLKLGIKKEKLLSTLEK